MGDCRHSKTVLEGKKKRGNAQFIEREKSAAEESIGKRGKQATKKERNRKEVQKWSPQALAYEKGKQGGGGKP